MKTSCMSLFSSKNEFDAHQEYLPTIREADPRIVDQLKQELELGSISTIFSDDYDGKLPILKVKIDGKKAYALFSTGNSVTFCTPSFAAKMGLEVLEVEGLSIRYNGRQMDFHGYTKTKLKLGTIKVETLILVTKTTDDYPYDLVVGVEFFAAIAKKYDYSITQAEDHFWFGPYKFPMLDQSVFNKKKVSTQKLKRDPQLIAQLKRSLESGFIAASFIADPNYQSFSPVIELKLNDSKVFGFFGTTIPITYCKFSVLKKLKLDMIEVDGLFVRCIGGGVVEFRGYTKAVIDLGPIQVETVILVSKKKKCPYDLMVGVDVFTAIAKQGHPFTMTAEHLVFVPHKFPFVYKKREFLWSF